MNTANILYRKVLLFKDALTNIQTIVSNYKIAAPCVTSNTDENFSVEDLIINELLDTIISKEEEVFIKAGEPLCYYVPFKREESKLVIDNNYDKYKPQIEGSMHRALSKFKNGYRRFNK